MGHTQNKHGVATVHKDGMRLEKRANVMLAAVTESTIRGSHTMRIDFLRYRDRLLVRHCQILTMYC